MKDNELTEYDILEEPRDDIYSRILNYAYRHCDYISFVIRFDLGLDPGGHKFLIHTKENIKRIDIVSEWPGTNLIDQVAIIVYLNFTESVLKEILNHTTGLYQWVQPSLPEDLCLYRCDNPWLASIAHERLSWLNIYPEELNDILVAIPELKKMVHIPDVSNKSNQ
ncbi:MAG: hypothetical protein KatS3mg107_1085 [Gemmataceae bacterium]|jgi:hypothetical protein|nr:MAG: hypothetical protein KatS3mg107_1085 [Gemmataceae bacterium]